jgi:gamma-glutamyl-gamma-aminobutyrate hydrolase PuuD
MKKILITQRIDWIESHQEYRESIDRRLIKLIRECGFLPVPLPNFDSSQIQAPGLCGEVLNTLSPDGILLSGGNDLLQFPNRDQTEDLVLNFARENRLPVLGICRGMQVLAVRNGAQLKKVQNHVRTNHIVTGVINRKVNSYHSYSITICPDDYSILARSEDGNIEAIRHNYLPWEGWMWHPERERELSQSDIQNIKRVFLEI